MNQIVIDASIALRWCFGDGSASDRALAMSVLEMLEQGTSISVPPIWPLEVGNVIARSTREGHLDKSRATAFFDVLNGLSVAIDASVCERALGSTFDLATRHRITTYDASYVELALHQSSPMATLDKDLRKVAKRAGVVLV